MAMRYLIGSEVLRGNTRISTDELKNKIVGLYFSASWCPPCRSFSPVLTKFYHKIRSEPKGKSFEVVFISSDSDLKSFTEYYDHMPWLAMLFEDRKRKQYLSDKFNIRGIPSLILVDGFSGRVITDDGRTMVLKDPQGKEFPWGVPPKKPPPENCDDGVCRPAGRNLGPPGYRAVANVYEDPRAMVTRFQAPLIEDKENLHDADNLPPAIIWNEQMDNLKARHSTMEKILESRKQEIKNSLVIWHHKGASSLLESLSRSPDSAVVADILPILTNYLTKTTEEKPVKIGDYAALFPVVINLMNSKYEEYIKRSVEFVLAVTKKHWEIIENPNSKEAMAFTRKPEELTTALKELNGSQRLQKLCSQTGVIGQKANVLRGFLNVL